MAESGLPTNPKGTDAPSDEIPINIFGYTPSLGLGLAAVIVFGLAAVIHLGHTAKWKGTRLFHLLLVLGCATEIVGYVFRIQAHSNPFVLNNFIVQYFFIVTSPILFSAAIYLSLATLVRSSEAYAPLTPLKPKFVLILFIVADCLTVAVQVVGAALVGIAEGQTAKNQTLFITPEHADYILVAGLAVQTLFSTVFLVILGVFIWRSHYRFSTTGRVRRPDRLLLAVISATALLIFIRTVFRLVEAGSGTFSSVATNEGLFIALEAVPVMLAVVLWAACPLAWRVRSTDKSDVAMSELPKGDVGDPEAVKGLTYETPDVGRKASL